MTALPHLDAATVEAAVSMAEAVSALENFLRRPPRAAVPRTAVEVGAGQLLLMPAESQDWVGVKLAGVVPANPARGLDRIQGLYVLLDGGTLEPVALMDGIALTNLRTPAVSALSATRLAVPEAEELVVFGTGPQARGHVLAMRAVRPLRRVRVVGRRADRVAGLVAEVHGLGLLAEAAGPEAVADADLVCCCTTAREPLFDGRLLPEHAHVMAVGSHEPGAREVDTATVERALVVVEDRATALREAGDVVLPVQEGAIGLEHLRLDLRELVAGAPVDSGRRTFFKSVGMAWEDLAVAELVHTRTSSAYRAQPTAPPAPVERTSAC